MRHEYFRGDVFAMAGGSPRHNALCSNVNAALHASCRAAGCRLFSSDQRIAVGDGERYVYPDVTVVCGPIRSDGATSNVIANPTIIVEVLSASTEPYDRGLKWEGYQRIASLTDYVLVSQSEPRIEHYRRGPDASWIYRSFGSGDHVTLTNGASVEIITVFDGVFEITGD